MVKRESQAWANPHTKAAHQNVIRILRSRDCSLRRMSSGAAHSVAIAAFTSLPFGGFSFAANLAKFLQARLLKFLVFGAAFLLLGAGQLFAEFVEP